MPTRADGKGGLRPLQRQIAEERTELTRALDELRREADLGAALRRRLPLVVAGALVAGFVLGGGIGALARLLLRRGREGTERARVGRFALAERR